MTALNSAPPRTSGQPGAIKVLVVDDSAVVRQMLTRELQRDPLIEVVGSTPIRLSRGTRSCSFPRMC